MTASRRGQKPLSFLSVMAMLLSLLGLLFLSAPPAFAGTACAGDGNASDVQRVFLEFGGTADGTYDGTAFLDSAVDDCTELGGNDIAFDDYADVAIHISCSEDLVGLVVGDLGAVTDFWVNTLNNGGNSAASCQPLETYPTPPPPPVVVTTVDVEDSEFTCDDDSITRTTTTTTTTTPYVLVGGEYVPDTENQIVDVVTNVEELPLNPDQIELCTPPPQVETTVTVETGEYACGDTEVATTTTTVTTTTPYVYNEELQDYVLGTPVTDEPVVVSGSRDLTADEQFPCPPPPPNTPPPPVLTLATAAFDGVCTAAPAPAISYDIDVTQTGDEPLGDTTVTVTDAAGTEVAEVTVTGEAEGVLELPGTVDGTTVDVMWSFDEGSTPVPLEECVEVLDTALEQPDPEPEPEPDPVVIAAAEELPETGATTDQLLVLGGALLALGCSLLLTEGRLARRRI